MNKTVVHFIDKNGFVIHQESDVSSRGGDSAQRTGMFLIGGYSLTRDLFQLKTKTASVWTLMNLHGEPVRHWNKEYWPGQKGIMSRDNLVPMFCALVLGELKWTALSVLIRLFFRLGFTWNTKKIGQPIGDTSRKLPDFCGPMIWFTFIRSLPLTKPLHFLFDAYLWLAVEIRMHKAYKDWDDVGDDLNLIVIIETWRLISDNWLLKMIRQDYLQMRPKAGPDDQRLGLNGVEQALKWYFHQPEAPPLDDLWIQVIKLW